MNRSLAALALASTLTLTLTACATETPATSSKSTASSSSAASPSPTASASKSWDCSPNSTLSEEDYVVHCSGADAAESDVDTEGSVTTPDGSFVRYPDGLKVSVVKVATDDEMGRLAAENSAEHADFDGGLHVTLRYENTGAAPISVNKMIEGVQTSLTYGANRYDATAYAVEDTRPNQLVPGTSAEQTWDFTLPRAQEADTLRLTTTPDTNVYTKYTFTDVETLLGR